MTTVGMGRFAVAAVVLAAGPGWRAEDAERKASPGALAVEVERYELANGLVVILDPDPTASGAAVWMSFRAGALYEPRGLGGLAHLVEHVMAIGPTPDTDYALLLERRRARFFNAVTSFDRMTFEVVVPAEELPIALWAAGDRLVAIPDLVNEEVVERNRRVVLEERALRDVDVPYGLFHEHVFRRLFEAPHPLHGGVIGVPAELARATAEDVRRFARQYLVPANGILTVAGRFDPKEARRLVAEALGGLPPGQRAHPPALPPLELGLVDRRQEPLARRPRVALAWRFPSAPPEDGAALLLGAQLLTFLTDGSFGMHLGAELDRYEGEDFFLLELTVPYDEPMSVVHGDAEGFLRQLTRREMPPDLVRAANLALDRVALSELDTLSSRAELLTGFEHAYGGRFRVADLLGWHWLLEPGAVRDVSRQYLKDPMVVVHARPTRPRPARVERQ
jgi:zinc protease